ncbi:hypothetical protein ACQJ0O_11360 [Pseudomonas shirazensis]
MKIARPPAKSLVVSNLRGDSAFMTGKAIDTRFRFNSMMARTVPTPDFA